MKAIVAFRQFPERFVPTRAKAATPGRPVFGTVPVKMYANMLVTLLGCKKLVVRTGCRVLDK
jgi:hypothetical protein